jgi:hypothetical protein
MSLPKKIYIYGMFKPNRERILYKKWNKRIRQKKIYKEYMKSIVFLFKQKV